MPINTSMFSRAAVVTTKHAKLIRYCLFGLLFLFVAVVFYFDLWDYITLKNMEIYNKKLGWWAPAVFILAFVVGELLQIPSVIWVFFAGLIWPIWLALPIALIATMLAATGAFLVARYFLGNQFHKKLPESFQKMNEKISKAPLRVVIVVRLTLFLHPLFHWVLAASPVKLSTFILGTFLGIFPPTIAIVLLGQQFLDWWHDYSYYIIALAVLGALIHVLVTRWKSKAVKSLE